MGNSFRCTASLHRCEGVRMPPPLRRNRAASARHDVKRTGNDVYLEGEGAR